MSQHELAHALRIANHLSHFSFYWLTRTMRSRSEWARHDMNFHSMPEIEKTWGYPMMIAGALSVCTRRYVVIKRAKCL